MNDNVVTHMRDKYKVFMVFNTKTQTYEGKVYGMGKDLPFEPLRSLMLGETWRPCTDNINRVYERVV